jgi:hypothetical protein
LTIYGRQERWEDSPTGWPQRSEGEHRYRTDGRPIVQWSRPEGRLFRRPRHWQPLTLFLHHGDWCSNQEIGDDAERTKLRSCAEPEAWGAALSRASCGREPPFCLCMKRREFIALLRALTATLLVARAQRGGRSAVRFRPSISFRCRPQMGYAAQHIIGVVFSDVGETLTNATRLWGGGAAYLDVSASEFLQGVTSIIGFATWPTNRAS